MTYGKAAIAKNPPAILALVGAAMIAYGVFHFRWAAYAMYDKQLPGWRERRWTRLSAVLNRWVVAILLVVFGAVFIVAGLS